MDLFYDALWLRLRREDHATVQVLRQGCIDGFSWSVSVHGKARLKANGLSPLQEV